MAKLRDILKFLDSWAPIDTALEFDNVGLLVDSDNHEVKRVAVCLDITGDTVSAAENASADLIVSHHPVIFSPLKRVEADSPVFSLVKSGIAAICMHTNLDAAEGGVNDTLAEKLGLCNIEPLDGDENYPPMARMGDIGNIGDIDGNGDMGANEPMTADRFAAYLKERLGCGGVKYVPTDRGIKKVAVCGGAGEEFIFAAKEHGCDALVTGESKHHINLAAAKLGIGLFCCGHFATEQVIKQTVANRLKENFSDIEVVLIDENDPSRYI